jgi:hypothetical protein
MDNNQVIGFELLRTINDINYIKVIEKLTETPFAKKKIREYLSMFYHFDCVKLNNLSLQMTFLKLSVYHNWFDRATHYIDSENGKEYIKEAFGDFAVTEKEPYFQTTFGKREYVKDLPSIICNDPNSKATRPNETKISVGDLRICALCQLDYSLILTALSILSIKDENEIKKYLKSKE